MQSKYNPIRRHASCDALPICRTCNVPVSCEHEGVPCRFLPEPELLIRMLESNLNCTLMSG